MGAAYNLARWLTRNEHDAEDVVQEAYLQAYRFFDGFHGSDFRAWLLTLVRNTCYTWLDNHLRSLMPGHLADVQSTDQHTVKPRFNGKLDFSPPVTNFAPQGFPLTGGRLDSVDSHAVAVLAYQRRRQHVINAYLWPSAGSADTGMSTTARQGYDMVRWTRGGVRRWLASDLNTSELESLANLLRAHDQ